MSDRAPLAGHRPVFVAGLHRSGTTPLARVLSGHPQVSGFSGTEATEDEGQHLQTVYPAARTYGGAGRFALDARSHLTEASPLATADNARRLAEEWSPHWDLSRPVLLEKSPPNLVMTRFLQELFPEARFVVIVRHPVVVALGTDKWLRGRSLRTPVANWFAAHDTFLEDLPHLRRVHVVRYEALVRDPAGELASVGRFLELDGEVPADAWQAGRSDAYARRWAALAADPLPWRRLLRRSLVREYGERAGAYGYDFEDLDALHPWDPVHAS
ncbi:MAG: sulfotransferase family protein [Nocardioidaceae bacterium]